MSAIVYLAIIVFVGSGMIALGAWMLRDLHRPIDTRDFVTPELRCRSLDEYRQRAQDRARTLPALTHCNGMRRHPLPLGASPSASPETETAGPSRPAAPRAPESMSPSGPPTGLLVTKNVIAFPRSNP